ncbi:hypothetical protein SGLAM104S_06523 [Streptomyces glaucescens]
MTRVISVSVAQSAARSACSTTAELILRSSEGSPPVSPANVPSSQLVRVLAGSYSAPPTPASAPGPAPARRPGQPGETNPDS